MKTIEEKNRLIAEFMGMESHHQDSSVLLKMTSQGNEVVLLHELQFHSSWDWLMPVLGRIDNLGHLLTEDSNLIGDITHGLVSLDLDMTHDAVVQFIEWYNENN